jgi:hypothetical protein
MADSPFHSEIAQRLAAQVVEVYRSVAGPPEAR